MCLPLLQCVGQGEARQCQMFALRLALCDHVRDVESTAVPPPPSSSLALLPPANTPRTRYRNVIRKGLDAMADMIMDYCDDCQLFARRCRVACSASA